jgi:hypothetical protein
MRIVRPGDGSLVIRLRPGFFEYALGLVVLLPVWTLLLGGSIPRDKIVIVLAAVLIAAGALAYIAEIADFRFDPVHRELRWSRKTLWKGFLTKTGVPLHGQAPLRDIRLIEVLSHYQPEKGYWVHRVVLTLPSGLLPLTRYVQTGRQSENVARAILSFLIEQGYHPRIRGFDPDGS